MQTYVSLCQTRLPNHSDGFSLKPNTPGKNINSSSSFDVRAQNNELQVTIRVYSTLASSPGWEPLSTTSLSGALSAKPSMPLSGFLTHFIIFEQQSDPHFVSPFRLRHVCQLLIFTRPLLPEGPSLQLESLSDCLTLLLKFKSRTE